MNKIAFLTCERFPDFTPSDKLVATYLQEQNIQPEIVVWNDPAIQLDKYELFLVRSVWDYHLLHEEWMAFLDKLEQNNCQVLNPISVLRWNSDKRYLKGEMADQKQIPLHIVERGEKLELEQLMRENAWEKVVIKPTVSASGYKTQNCDLAGAAALQDDLNLLLKERSIIIQEFCPEVVEKGEWSLMFFDKEYSHSVLKRAKKGDFRVQSDYGGSVEPLEAPPAAISTAKKILDGLKESISYARVDGIMRDDKFYLMELELIEPELFINQKPDSEKAFGEAILRKLNRI